MSPDSRERSTETVADFDSIVAIMQEALDANTVAHSLEERHQDPTFSFEAKNKCLVRLYMEHGGSGYVVVSHEGKLIRFSVAGTHLTCHSKRDALRKLIRGNGYPPGIRAALYQVFGIKPPAAPKSRKKGNRKPRRHRHSSALS